MKKIIYFIIFLLSINIAIAGTYGAGTYGSSIYSGTISIAEIIRLPLETLADIAAVIALLLIILGIYLKSIDKK